MGHDRSGIAALELVSDRDRYLFDVMKGARDAIDDDVITGDGHEVGYR
jgi:hypothetical protein